MTSLTITVPIPHKSLSPNWRGHWAVKAKAVAASRRTAMMEVLRQSVRVRAPKHKAATVHIQWFTKTVRHPDGDGALSSLKAVFDGVQDSGFIEDDNRLTHQPIQFAKDAANPRVVLTFTAETQQTK